MLPVHFGNILSETPKVHERPPYQLIVDGAPQRVVDGRDDFLVITSIPNVCSPLNRIFDHRLVNIAGFHGAGMRAIDLVLQEEFLEKTYRRVSHLKQSTESTSFGWQALVRVEVDQASGDMPKKLGEFNVFRIDNIDFRQVTEHVREHGILIDADDLSDSSNGRRN